MKKENSDLIELKRSYIQCPVGDEVGGGGGFQVRNNYKMKKKTTLCPVVDEIGPVGGGGR